jgi:RimJ/RimL family protein N-acetyltransferase
MSYHIKKHIQSARLSLVAITNEELALYQNLHADPVTMKFIGPCFDEAQSKVFFQRSLKHTEKADSSWNYFAVKLNGHSQVIGFVTLIAKPKSAAPFEAGIMLSPEGRGLGYADEALTALFLHCFTEAQVPALGARVNPQNLAAVKHIKQFGFVDAPDEHQEKTELDRYFLYPTDQNMRLLQQLSERFYRQADMLADA